MDHGQLFKVLLQVLTWVIPFCPFNKSYEPGIVINHILHKRNLRPREVKKFA